MVCRLSWRFSQRLKKLLSDLSSERATHRVPRTCSVCTTGLCIWNQDCSGNTWSLFPGRENSLPASSLKLTIPLHRCGLVHTPGLSLSDYLEGGWLSRDLYFHGCDRIIFILVNGQGTDYLALVHPSSEGVGSGLATDRKVSWASSLILTHGWVLDEVSLTHNECYSFGLEATTPH